MHSLIKDQDPTSCRGHMVGPSDGGLIGGGAHLFAYLTATKFPGVNYCLEAISNCFDLWAIGNGPMMNQIQ